MKYRLLVFDWDGTIINSASAIAECIRLAAADVGLPVPTKEQASHVIGLGLHDALRHAVPDLRPEHVPEFVERYREHFRASEHTMDLFGGMRELLQSLRARGSWASQRARAAAGSTVPSTRRGCGPISAPRAAPTRRTQSRIQPCCSS